MTQTVITPKFLIKRAAIQHAKRIALSTEDRDWTFAEIDERACRLANALLERGVRPDVPVATLRHNAPEHVEISLALLKLGAPMVNVNPRLTADDMVWQVNHCEAPVLLVAAEFGEQVAAFRDRLEHTREVIAFGGDAAGHTVYEDVLRAASSREPEVPGYSIDNLAYLRYTSGTTGRPKGVLHDQRIITAVTRNLLLDYVSDLNAGDALLVLQGIYHGAGWFVLPCWLRGARLVLATQLDVELGLRLAERFQVTHVKTIPTLLTRLLDAPELDSRWPRDRVRSVVYGGSPMARSALEEGIDRLGPVFVQLYGQAESPMTITVLPREEHHGERLSSAGRAVTFAHVRAVDDDGREVPTGETGELVVHGDHNMRGYWREPPEATAAVMRDGWVHTGDMARIDEAGYVYLVDRRGDMIVTGGLNVYPNEVEQVLCSHPAVLEAVVVGAPDREWGEAITAFAVLRNGRTLEDAELAAFAGGRLPGFKRPKRVEIVDSLPKNASGKLVRRAIKERLWAGHERKVN